MIVVCGTDFSAAATVAAHAVAALARRAGATLLLVHATPSTESDVRLKDQARALGLGVETLQRVGEPAEQLVEVAAERGAALIAVANHGDAGISVLGRTATRVARTSPVPVLIVRDGSGIEAWTAGQRPLKALLCADFSSATTAAAAYLGRLRDWGPVDAIIGHVAWPPGEHARLGIEGPMPLDCLRAEVSDVITRDLSALVGEVRGEGALRYRIEAGLGRVDSHLALMAENEAVDLVVVGAHQRSNADRLWLGTVSGGLVHQVSTSVLCVPASGDMPGLMPAFRRVIASTDLTAGANRALPYALALLGDGGKLHLLHVAKAGANVDALEHQLLALIPPAVRARGMDVTASVTVSENVAQAICQSAERLSADAIVMATSARTGVARLLLGSVAQAVTEIAHRPVLLVPPRRGD